jgi:hypothetical protein
LTTPARPSTIGRRTTTNGVRTPLCEIVRLRNLQRSSWDLAQALHRTNRETPAPGWIKDGGRLNLIRAMDANRSRGLGSRS